MSEQAQKLLKTELALMLSEAGGDYRPVKTAPMRCSGKTMRSGNKSSAEKNGWKNLKRNSRRAKSRREPTGCFRPFSGTIFLDAGHRI